MFNFENKKRLAIASLFLVGKGGVYRKSCILPRCELAKWNNCHKSHALKTIPRIVFFTGFRIHPRKKLNKTKKTRCCKSFFGGQGWIRTTEVVDGRFTVCSLWPLGNLPILNLQKNGAGGRTRTPDLLITNQLLYQLSYTSVSTLEYNIITI